MYSGPVAAYAYNAARRDRVRALVLVGPSHFVPFEGVSIWSAGAWDTPLGPVTVDSDLAAAIASEWPRIVELPAAHGREHSLEMQMPFVAHLFPGVPIVPLVMGHQTRETAFALGAAIGRAVAARARGRTARGQQRSLALRGCRDRRIARPGRHAARRDARRRRADVGD